MAPQEMDVAAKHFEPSAGKANIYVTRTSAYRAGDPVILVVDGKFRGSLLPNTYFLFEVDPGTHTVAVLGFGNREVVTLHTEAGQNYFLAVGMGFPFPFDWIEPRDEEEGREAVLGSSLAEQRDLAPNVEESQER
jgi:hypothetical protein